MRLLVCKTWFYLIKFSSTMSLLGECVYDDETCVCVGCVVSVEGSMLEARVFQLESRKISSKFCNFVSLANPHSWQFIQTWVYLLSASVNVLNFSARRNKFAPPQAQHNKFVIPNSHSNNSEKFTLPCLIQAL